MVTIKQGSFKSDILTEVCAVLAFSAIKNNDKVGLLLFSSQVELFIHPKKGKSHILRIIREMVEFKPKHKGTNIAGALEYLNHIAKKRNIVFLMSDFLSDDFSKPLRIAGRKHDLTGLHIYDRAERLLPDVGLARMMDAETGQSQWVDTSDPRWRKAFSDFYARHKNQMEDLFARSGSSLISMSTTDSYIKALRSFFINREKRK